LETERAPWRLSLNENVIGFASFKGTARVAYNESGMAGAIRVSPRAITAESKSETSAMRILAVDYGRKRIGLALSDELGLTAQPLLTLERLNRRDDLRRLREICARHDVAHILVGHPVHMTGEAGEMAAEAARFAARLSKELRIETELIDERLTSWEAKRSVAEANSPKRRKGEAIDAIAAAILLRDYLEHRPAKTRGKRQEKE
jgi:putative Holliday junction resolvase